MKRLFTLSDQLNNSNLYASVSFMQNQPLKLSQKICTEESENRLRRLNESCYKKQIS